DSQENGRAARATRASKVRVSVARSDGRTPFPRLIPRLQLVAAVSAEARTYRVHGCTVPTRERRRRRGRRVSGVADCVLEIFDRAADALPKLGQPICTEDNDHDDEDDDQFR